MKNAWLFVAALWMVVTGVFGPGVVAKVKSLPDLATAATCLVAVFAAWLMAWVWIAVIALDGRGK
jgi:hypothetical protein